jgi:hypothetical protein
MGMPLVVRPRHGINSTADELKPFTAINVFEPE